MMIPDSCSAMTHVCMTSTILDLCRQVHKCCPREAAWSTGIKLSSNLTRDAYGKYHSVCLMDCLITLSVTRDHS